MSTERKYAIIFPVQPRTERAFSKEEIELAAKVHLLQDMPVGCTLAEEPGWEITWATDMLDPVTRALRVAAKVVA